MFQKSVFCLGGGNFDPDTLKERYLRGTLHFTDVEIAETIKIDCNTESVPGRDLFNYDEVYDTPYHHIPYSISHLYDTPYHHIQYSVSSFTILRIIISHTPYHHIPYFASSYHIFRIIICHSSYSQSSWVALLAALLVVLVRLIADSRWAREELS